MNVEFLSNLIQKYKRDDVHIYVSDDKSRIIACSESSRIGSFGNTARYIIAIRHPASVQDTSAIYSGPSHYGVPIKVYGTIKYVVVTYGNPEYTIPLCHTLQAALETALEYQEFRHKKADKKMDELEQIASLMLSDHSDKEKLLELMGRNQLDPALTRFVIDIHLNLEEMASVNPALAYDSSVAALKKSIITKLKTHKSLNQQDLFYSPDQNNILIIKTITKSQILSETYASMDALCEEFIDILHQCENLSFYIAYGNFSNKLDNIHASWMEATELLQFGQIHADREFCSMDHLLLDYMAVTLTPHFINRYLTSVQEKLFQKDSKIQTHLLDTAEAFVDNQFNLTATSQAMHLHRNTVTSYPKQFTALTGYDPAGSFQDALLTKLMAVHVRYSSHYKSTQKTL